MTGGGRLITGLMGQRGMMRSDGMMGCHILSGWLMGVVRRGLMGGGELMGNIGLTRHSGGVKGL